MDRTKNLYIKKGILMYISKIINSFLSNLDIVITRRSTVDLLHNRINEFANMYKKQDTIQDTTHQLKVELLQHQISSYWSIVDHIDKKYIDTHVIRECPLCNYQDDDESFKKFNSHCIFGGGILHRHQCPKCDLVFGPDKVMNLSDAELTQDYEWHYKVYSEGDSTEQELKAFYALNPIKEGIYLNFGAGAWSHSIKILRTEGWNVYGYEPHSSVQQSSEYIITNEARLRDIKFDGIFSNNVLEHFKRPEEELRMMGTLLNNGALMSHATPCFEYLYEYTRFHLFFFLGRSRKVLADKAGLAIVDFIVEDEYMNIILKDQ